MCKNKGNEGFTLIEIILVVTIIGILVAVVMPRLVGRSEEARISAARLQIENISVALDTFELDNGFYPATAEGLDALYEKSYRAEHWKGPYLKKRVGKDPWGMPYVYVHPGVHNQDYDLKSYGSNKADGGNDDITNWD